MLRSKPKLTYGGLTVILEKPSRFDGTHLLSANGGMFFAEECLYPLGINQYQCDIRIAEDEEPLLPNTKAVLLLGEGAADKYLPKGNNLNELRGSPFIINGVAHVASYFPQDCVDHQDYEGRAEGEEDSSSDDDTAPSDVKSRHNKTQRKNFRFWLQKDTARAVEIIRQHDGKIPESSLKPNYITYPSSTTVIERLTTTKNAHLHIDIETDENLNIQCFAFSFNMDEDIYCVPVFKYDYTWAYSNLHQIFRALAIAFRDNIVVAHNGSNFDFFVFGYKYRIPIGVRVEDTLLMQSRIYPSVEKSLGHCITLWTWEKFHKDMGNSGYMNLEQMMQRLLYCGTDVFGMKLVHQAQWTYAKRVPGLVDSFNQVNASIRPYLTTTFTGFEYDEQKLKDVMHENDRYMNQYLRIINMLVGEETIKTFRSRYKSALPSSNTQCVEYFHNLLGYPVVGWGKPSKVDGKRKPSLSKKNIFKLRIKFENPVIDYIIAYRALAKESGSLKFNPWVFDNGIYNTTTDNSAANSNS